jgi:hypothetical protein
MNCYTRHLGDVLVAAGPDVWKSHIKPMLADDQQKLEPVAEINKLFKKS